MSKKNKFSLTCSEANHVCDKSQYNESTFWEKVKLNLHLLYCKVCRKYAKNNTKLSSIITESKVTCMDKKDKECLKKDFEKVLNENHLK